VRRTFMPSCPKLTVVQCAMAREQHAATPAPPARLPWSRAAPWFTESKPHTTLVLGVISVPFLSQKRTRLRGADAKGDTLSLLRRINAVFS
jgi:hypothetical protein